MWLYLKWIEKKEMRSRINPKIPLLLMFYFFSTVRFLSTSPFKHNSFIKFSSFKLIQAQKSFKALQGSSLHKQSNITAFQKYFRITKHFKSTSKVLQVLMRNEWKRTKSLHLLNQSSALSSGTSSDSPKKSWNLGAANSNLGSARSPPKSLCPPKPPKGSPISDWLREI